MSKKGYKYLKHPSIGVNSKKEKQNDRGHETCECGSGRLFKDCCYRPDHRIFHLDRHFEKLKNIKLRMNDIVAQRLLEEYMEKSEIQDIADKMSDQMQIPDIRQEIERKSRYEEEAEDPNSIIASAIRLESLTVDLVLPGHKKPLIQECLNLFLRRASDREKECYNSYGFSQFSFYEVIAVKNGQYSLKNSWLLLRDLFTNEKFELKDPQFTGSFHIWDILVGRRYIIDGFTIFSTAVFIINHRQIGAYNRILFLFWLKSKIKNGSNSLISINERNTELFTLIKNKYADLQTKYFYTSELCEYIKKNSSVLVIIQNLLIKFNRDYPIIFKSPDNCLFMYITCEGKINSSKIQEIVDILRKDSKTFEDTSDSREKDIFRFDYLIPRKNMQYSEEDLVFNFAFEKLSKLSHEGIVHLVLKELQTTLVIGTSSLNLNWSKGQILSAADKIHDDLIVRIGFIEINRDTIKFTTYSEESMRALCSCMSTLLGPLILELSAPRILDLQKQAQVEEKINETSFNDYREDNEKYYDDDTSDLLYEDLDKNDITDDKELDDYLSIASRMMKRDSIKSWIHQKIPVLGGKTPKECVSDSEKLPILVDLIKDMENIADKDGYYQPKNSYSSLLKIDPKNFY